MLEAQYLHAKQREATLACPGRRGQLAIRYLCPAHSACQIPIDFTLLPQSCLALLSQMLASL